MGSFIGNSLTFLSNSHARIFLMEPLLKKDIHPAKLGWYNKNGVSYNSDFTGLQDAINYG